MPKNLFSDNKALWRGLVFGLIIGGSLLRIFICFQHNPMGYFFSDPLRHWLNGRRFFSPDMMGASDPILYQVYIFLLRRITGLQPWRVALISSVLSVLMPWTYYRAGIGMSKMAALWVWALIACTPSLFTIYHYFMPETLLLFLVGFSLWMTTRCLRRCTWQTWLLAVVSWTLAVLTKTTVVPLAGICLFYVWWQSKRRVGFALLGAVVILVMMIPNAVRTKKYLGFVAPLGNSWITKIQHRSGAHEIRIYFRRGINSFASPSAYTEPLAPLSSWKLRRYPEGSRVVVRVSAVNGDKDWSKAYEALHISSKEWLLQWWENAVFFFFAPSWPDTNLEESDGWITYHTRWLWAPLIVFLVCYNIWVLRRREFELLPIAVTTFTFFLAFQNLVTMEGRYRKPLEPLLLLNLVWAITHYAKSGARTVGSWIRKKDSLIGVLCLLVVILGILFRLSLFGGGAWREYQHDIYSHTQVIYHLVTQGKWPSLHSMWQAPQQPFYYWVTSLFWRPPDARSVVEMWPLAFFSALISCTALIVCYRASRCFASGILRLAFIGFLALTPSIVLSSCRVNNDTFAAFWGQIAFACTVWAWRRPGYWFWVVAAVGSVFLALVSKLNAISLVIVFPFLFWRLWSYSKAQHLKIVVLGTVTIILLSVWGGWSLNRSRLANHRLNFCHYQLFEEQVIPSLSFSYWTSFHYLDLLKTAHASTGRNASDAVRFSFPTQHYGTLFTGEYWLLNKRVVKQLVRMIYVLGLMVPLGCLIAAWVAVRNVFRLKWRGSPRLLYLAIATTIVSVVLVMAFVAQIPNVCSSDFRYNAPVFPWIALAFASGMVLLAGKSSILKKALLGLMIVFFCCESLLVSFIVLNAV